MSQLAGASTHLETCECEEIQKLVNTTVQKAVAGLEEKMDSISSAMSQFNVTARNISGITEAMKQLLQPIQQQLNYHLPPPPVENSQQNPATSCKGLLKKQPNADSGYYWISRSSGSPVRMYCDMSETACGDQRGGWMRVANLDMTNTSHTCPSGFNTMTSPKRLCYYSSSYSCRGTTSVLKVCSTAVCVCVARSLATNTNFLLPSTTSTRSIDSASTFGMVLTHGRPRKHTWTFVGASDESTNGQSSVPSYVGNDYFWSSNL